MIYYTVGAERKISGAHWLVSLLESVNPKVQREAVSQKTKVPDTTTHLHTQTYTHTLICTALMCTNMWAHT